MAKDRGDKAAATITGGVTPVYAAPETFDGWLSRYSDQYSLAIVYQEILTGQRPFTGSTMRQLVLQHLQAVPELTSLPLADRPIIGRALNKNPDACDAYFGFVANDPELGPRWSLAEQHTTVRCLDGADRLDVSADPSFGVGTVHAPTMPLMLRA